MEIAQEFQRVDPRFHLSGFVAEERGTRAGEGQKFPGADGAGEFEGRVWLLLSVGELSGAENSGDRECDEKKASEC